MLLFVTKNNFFLNVVVLQTLLSKAAYNKNKLRKFLYELFNEKIIQFIVDI